MNVVMSCPSVHRRPGAENHRLYQVPVTTLTVNDNMQEVYMQSKAKAGQSRMR